MAIFGFDFRNTSAYVTDPSTSTFQLCPTGTANPAYPTTKSVNGQSITFGWESGTANVDSRDRNSGIDARLAGINFVPSTAGGSGTWRVDLPSSGSWTLNMAMGDASGAQTINLNVKDTNTTLFSFANTAVASGSFLDANGTAWTAANWPASNTSKTVTFTTTICRVVFNVPSSLSTTLTHMLFTSTGNVVFEEDSLVKLTVWPYDPAITVY